MIDTAALAESSALGLLILYSMLPALTRGSQLHAVLGPGAEGAV